MPVEHFKIPLAIVQPPRLTSGRKSEICFSAEDQNAVEQFFSLTFDGVLAYKFTSPEAISGPMIEAAYGRVAELGSSEWLSEVAQLARRLPRKSPLRHFMALFDDEGCWEFICEGFQSGIAENSN
jgi:hypothetical protein